MRRLFALLSLAASLLGCGPTDLVGDERALAYPPGPYAIELGATLPDLRFAGVSDMGNAGDIALRDYYAPERRDLLLVMVSGGLWCGTCRWPAEHAADLLGDEANERVRRLDLVVADRDNAPADAGAAASWQQRFDALRGVAVGADPADRLRAVLDGKAAPLPLWLLIDASRMRIVDVANNPSVAELRQRVDRALADLDDVAPPSAEEEPLIDDLFHVDEWDLLRTTRVPGAPPPDATNAFADSAAAAALGRELFFDAGLSPSGTVSCASCHRPDAQLSDGLARGHGVADGDRRTPSIALSAHAPWQFWDGRADSLWAQALGPLENALEMDSSRVFVARRVLSTYADAYRAAFPDAIIPDTAGWPAGGKPGEVAYDAMSETDRQAATRTFVHAGKAIEAWERTLRVEPNPLDAYLGGDLDALSPQQKYGLQLFVRSGCMQCHWGPRLTDDAFHNLRLPSGRHDGGADRGRLAGLAAWRASEFRGDGSWSDAPSEGRSASAAADSLLGQFKTPALRGVAGIAFYAHGGTFADLAQVTEAYGTGGVPTEDRSSAGTREPWLVDFGETVQWGLVPFLELLTARPLLAP